VQIIIISTYDNLFCVRSRKNDILLSSTESNPVCGSLVSRRSASGESTCRVIVRLEVVVVLVRRSKERRKQATVITIV
jgi:hypothetical protein